MRRVYAYVVADLLHPGHIRHLVRARQLGDRLIVGVLNTKAALEKKQKPINTTVARMEVIRALRCVDQVVWQREYSPLENIKHYRPDVLAESEDHAEQPANAWCDAHGIAVHGLPYTKGISSTKIKERVVREHEATKRR